MFTTAERASIRADLLAQAAQDKRIVSGAITGSAATGREDDWSDIDLAFGIASGVPLGEVLSDWTAHMYDVNAAVHHVDTPFGKWFYRTFLLPHTLQVDLAFVPSDHFQALGPNFKMVFGVANEPARFERPTSAQMNAACRSAIDRANACIHRGAPWQADHFLGVARDSALVSACLKNDLPYHHARGFDLLPKQMKAPYETAFATSLDSHELSRCLQVLAGTLDDSAEVQESAVPELVEADRGMGLAWLYALHTRGSIWRRKVWQAEYMIRGMRNSTLGLARLRSGGKLGTPLHPELLPQHIDALFRDTRLQALDLEELQRAFRLLIQRLNSEVSFTGFPQAGRLQQAISALV
jgi:hypothetical protein